MKWLMMLFAVLGGMAVGTQAGINGSLGKKVGTLEATLITFSVSTLFLFIIAVALGKGNVFSSAVSVPKWQLTGGLLGAFYVFMMVLIVPKLGTASTIIAIIAGQLLATSVIDHYGLIGGKQIPMDWQRAVGLLLMAVAIILFNKR